MESNVQFYSGKIDKLTQVIDYQNQRICELENKLERQDAERVKPNLFISGIQESHDKNCIEVVQSFFKNQMEITETVQIVKAFRVGQAKNKPIKVILRQAGDKGIIFKNAPKLKDKQNYNGFQFQINEQLPSQKNEEKKKRRRLMKANKQTTADKITVSMKKGELFIDNAKYVQPLKLPDCTKLLQLKVEELVALNSIKVQRGLLVQVEGSTFSGYACDVNNFEQANHAYEYVRYHNMNARHVIAATIVPGENVAERFCYEDDFEHGAGAKLLDYMTNAHIDCRAVFVVRNYDGTHIGPQRFDAIIDAAKSTIRQKPYNVANNSFQFPWVPSRGRGGRQCRSRRTLQYEESISDHPPQDSVDEEEITFKAAGSENDRTMEQSVENNEFTDQLLIQQQGRRNSWGSATQPSALVYPQS